MKQAYINCLKKLREFRKNLKLDKDVFVLPVSSKNLQSIKKFEEGKISQKECNNRKDKIAEIVQLDNIIGFDKETQDYIQSIKNTIHRVI